MSSLRFVLLPVIREAKHDFFFRSMFNKTIIGFGFFDIQDNQGLGKGYQPHLISTLIILDITKTPSSNRLLLNGFSLYPYSIIVRLHDYYSKTWSVSSVT